MKKDYIVDYAGYTLIKIFGPVMRLMPRECAYWVGRMVGGFFYFFDGRHRARVFAHLTIAVGNTYSPSEIKCFTKKFFRAYGQNAVDLFLIPRITPEYIKRFVTIEGMEYIHQAFKKGTGVIFAGVHEGSWELSNIISANLGFPYCIFVREQRYPKLNSLLAEYRSQRGCVVIKRGGARELVQIIKTNRSFGISIDQGGASGIRIKFFGKEASLSSGAVKIALKYGAVILPVFCMRTHGPRITYFINPPLEIKNTGADDADVVRNLQKLAFLFERCIVKYPHEYLWTYKVWKYGTEREIVILNDGKTGHLRQSQSFAAIASEVFASKGFKPRIMSVPVSWKSPRHKKVFMISLVLGIRSSLRAAWLLEYCLDKETFSRLRGLQPDCVVSCGSSVAGLNVFLSRDTGAKSFAIMRPPWYIGLKNFNLVVMPRHDNPPRSGRVVTVEGALNLVDEKYLREQSILLRRDIRLTKNFIIGLLIGGDAGQFVLDKEIVCVVIEEIKKILERYDGEVLVTTSRRTSAEVEQVIKKELHAYSRCSLSVIANEYNNSAAMGGILGLSSILIVSPESISMVSEAVSSGKPVIVFNAPAVRARHKRFLENLAEKNYLCLADAEKLEDTVRSIIDRRYSPGVLPDRARVHEELKKIM
ncbi:MAG: ELM1/GtrOC1 family putative glycosyltransferase [Candidatus Omnitrophica bacterium]|nr:ELM1/GtrOC1 family putative glycosyltransferase [Candidatus Omnitrophota bacterium]